MSAGVTPEGGARTGGRNGVDCATTGAPARGGATPQGVDSDEHQWSVIDRRHRHLPSRREGEKVLGGREPLSEPCAHALPQHVLQVLLVLQEMRFTQSPRGKAEAGAILCSHLPAHHEGIHPLHRAAVERQLALLPHVMFGGLAHEPALTLARRLAASWSSDAGANVTWASARSMAAR